MSFRIYNNIPKTIITPQIKTLSLPFTIPNNQEEVIIGIIPKYIYILAFKIILHDKITSSYAYGTIIFKTQDEQDEQNPLDFLFTIIENQRVGFNISPIIPLYLRNQVRFNNTVAPTNIPPQEAVIEISYYQL